MSGSAGGARMDAAVVDALADGLAGWIGRATRSEEQLAAFAFREGTPGAEVPPASSLGYFVGRVLAAAGDTATLRLLAAAGDGIPFAELVRREDLGTEPGDRVALAERIAAAASAGLVSRELDGDRVACTPLGSALLGLVAALEDRLAARLEPRATAAAGR